MNYIYHKSFKNL